MKSHLTNWLHRYPMILILIPIVIFILWRDKADKPIEIYSDTAEYYRAALTDFPVARNKTLRYTATLNTGQNVYLYFAKDSLNPLPTAGDTVIVHTCIKPGGILGYFDYGRYLRRQGIAGSGYVARGEWHLCGHHNISGPKAWRQYLMARYKQVGINEHVLPVLSAITLGYKEDLDDNTKRQFQRSGAAHILAVSGLHTGLIAALIISILTLWGRYRPLYDEIWRRILNGLFLIVGIWIYAAITGMPPSVVRSAIMVTLATIAYLFYRQQIGLNTLAAAAVAILLIRPNDLFSVSFQLSFTAIAAIIITKDLMPTRHNIVTISIAAQFGVLPLTLYYFNQTSNYFILTNLGVLPLAQIAVYLAVGVLAFGSVPYIGTALVWLENLTIELLLQYTGWIEQLPYAVTERAITPMITVLLYAIIIVGIILLKFIKR